MAHKDQYLVATTIRQLCAVLKLSADRVLRRAGLPADYLENERKGIPARQVFRVWDAVEEEAKRPDLPLHLGQAMANGPFATPLFAFSCSPDVRTGLTRLSLFKPLIAPITLHLEPHPERLDISFSSLDPDHPLPPGFAVFELVYFLETTRSLTAEHIIPLAVGQPVFMADQAVFDAFYGTTAQISARPTLSLARADADRPLVSQNAAFWAGFEPELQRQLAEKQIGNTTQDRVRQTLLELLPSGRTTAEDVSKALGLGKRSLQRHLHRDGESFQSILDCTRSGLALHYLSDDQISIAEISYLLGYRDPNSFYRAFQGWTGLTPQQARSRKRA